MKYLCYCEVIAYSTQYTFWSLLTLTEGLYMPPPCSPPSFLHPLPTPLPSLNQQEFKPQDFWIMNRTFLPMTLCTTDPSVRSEEKVLTYKKSDYRTYLHFCNCKSMHFETGSVTCKSHLFISLSDVIMQQIEMKFSQWTSYKKTSCSKETEICFFHLVYETTTLLQSITQVQGTVLTCWQLDMGILM